LRKEIYREGKVKKEDAIQKSIAPFW